VDVVDSAAAVDFVAIVRLHPIVLIRGLTLFDSISFFLVSSLCFSIRFGLWGQTPLCFI
jgi:hypothetical protein